jgi:3-oxoacyl-[acyl-carrier-protein] synthase-3
VTALGIESIASYIPERRISNYDRKKQFGLDDSFIENKLGVKAVAVKGDDEETSDLCVRAYEALQNRVGVNRDAIDVIVVVTQNPDTNIPHTSAIVQGKLGLPETCAAFDVSLGCSGFVYGLSIIQAFMQANGLSKGLLFTADPYSKIVDVNDKNTALLFGDAASVTLISDKPEFTTGIFTFGTSGKEYKELISIKNKLYMNGRAVFNFTAKYVPRDILHLLEINQLDLHDISRFIFHQGSKYIVDTIAGRLGLNADRVVFNIYQYGNTVSSSIPIILEKEIMDDSNKYMVISGFGVGLSWSSAILKRGEKR